MGLRGPTPKTREQHIQDGTYRHDRHGHTPNLAPRVSSLPEPPKPPAHLGAPQRKVWREVVPKIAALLQESDLAAVEMTVVALAQFREANEQLSKPAEEGGGLMVDQLFGFDKDTGEALYRPAPSPWLSIREKAAKDFRDWSARLGLTPSDRARLGLDVANGMKAAQSIGARIGESPRARAST